MHILRTRFKKEIIAEFLPPRKSSRKVIILCGGMPGIPKRQDMVEFFTKKGYWTFYPRYRGTWESGGTFLKTSPHRDVLDILDELPKGFMSFYDEKKYQVQPQELYVVGSSFGGPAAILASRDERVTKAMAISSVVDWRAPSRAEPMGRLEQFVTQAFGEGYRFSHGDWVRLSRGKIYQPVNHISEIDGKKLFLIHAKDDEVVPWRPTAKFAKAVDCKLWLLPRGGHLSISLLMKPRFYKRMMRFLKER